MRITITAKLVGNRVSEGSAFSLIASFFNDSTDVWSAVTPTSARYRIDRVNGDPDCWDTVLDWTTLTPATSNTITITGAQNAITSCGSEERRMVTVQADTGLSGQVCETYRYRIENLEGQS